MRTLGSQTVAETVPILVDAATGVPVRMPMRWVVRHLRGLAPNTISDYLRALALCYEWVDASLCCDADDFFEAGGRLDGGQIDALIAFLRTRVSASEQKRIEADAVPTLGTLAKIAGPVRRFLAWAADPMLRGGRDFVPVNELTAYSLRLKTLFKPVERNRNRGQRIEPLDDHGAALLDLIGPIRDASGRIVLTQYRFGERNPFEPETRLRNWLIAPRWSLRWASVAARCSKSESMISWQTPPP